MGVQEAGEKPALNWDSIKFKAQSLLRQGSDGARVNDQGKANAEQTGMNTEQTPGQPAANNTTTPTSDPAEAMALVRRVFSSPDGTISDADRSAVVSMLTANTSLSEADATRQVQEWEQTARKARQEYESMKVEAEQKARSAAAATAKLLANAAWLAFVATVLAASAAMVGAHLGGPRESVRGNRVREPGGMAGATV
jgi:hypothetical protein